MFFKSMKKCFWVLSIGGVISYGVEASIHEKTWLDTYDEKNHSRIASPSTLRVEVKYMREQNKFRLTTFGFGDDCVLNHMGSFMWIEDDASLLLPDKNFSRKFHLPLLQQDIFLNFKKGTISLSNLSFPESLKGFDLISNVKVTLQNIYNSPLSPLVRIYAPRILQKKGTENTIKTTILRTESVEKRYEKAQEDYKNESYEECIKNLLSLEEDGVRDGWIFYALGKIYIKKEDEENNFKKANEYFKKSIEEGNLESFLSLAEGHFEGRREETNPAKAVKLLEKGLKKGLDDPRIFEALDSVYNRGKYVQKKL